MNCPKCGKEIEYLLCDTKEYNAYFYNGVDYVSKNSFVAEAVFTCPSCENVVARDEETAKNLFSQPTPP